MELEAKGDSDSNILCLSWKGRVPKSEKEKPVCRRRYYEEGWLATGNGRGVVGVTFTSSHCRRDRNTPQRINFNLRGHNSEPLSATTLTNIWPFLSDCPPFSMASEFQPLYELSKFRVHWLVNAVSSYKGETSVAGVQPISGMLSKQRMTLPFVKLSKRVGDLALPDSQQKAAVSSTDAVSREDNGQQQKAGDYQQYGEVLKLMS
ncbi:hypothetical protein WISP_113191 [Willisornis vidua]|uniref:Uncharacterized protein n=1 Tax=Willisornis vidua TaxID=1566151 RepID=A0ABQ9CZT2_9PASS|nr:hypothetical protein WISP_113191 [Willisornis vidua]